MFYRLAYSHSAQTELSIGVLLQPACFSLFPSISQAWGEGQSGMHPSPPNPSPQRGFGSRGSSSSSDSDSDAAKDGIWQPVGLYCFAALTFCFRLVERDSKRKPPIMVSCKTPRGGGGARMPKWCRTKWQVTNTNTMEGYLFVWLAIHVPV